jgi:ABC-type transport system involved in cytochrome c biogenesis permease component
VNRAREDRAACGASSEPAKPFFFVLVVVALLALALGGLTARGVRVALAAR